MGAAGASIRLDNAPFKTYTHTLCRPASKRRLLQQEEQPYDETTTQLWKTPWVPTTFAPRFPSTFAPIHRHTPNLHSFKTHDDPVFAPESAWEDADGNKRQGGWGGGWGGKPNPDAAQQMRASPKAAKTQLSAAQVYKNVHAHSVQMSHRAVSVPSCVGSVGHLAWLTQAVLSVGPT